MYIHGFSCDICQGPVVREEVMESMVRLAHVVLLVLLDHVAVTETMAGMGQLAPLVNTH